MPTSFTPIILDVFIVAPRVFARGGNRALVNCLKFTFMVELPTAVIGYERVNKALAPSSSLIEEANAIRIVFYCFSVIRDGLF